MNKNSIKILFGVNFLVITIFWWLTSGQILFTNPSLSSILIIFGRITGLWAVYLILAQLLTIGRVKWIEKVFGLDRLSVIHHWLGIVSFALIILHFILLSIGYALLNELNWWGQINDFVTNWEDLISATIALILFILTVVGSITIVKRKMKYETWYYIHLFTYLAILLAYGHQIELGYDLQANYLFSAYWLILYIFTAINYIIYRFVWQIYLFKKYQFRVEKIVPETEDTFSIYIGGNNIKNFKFLAGQFIFIRFLDKKLIWQAHPYSLSCAAGKDYLRVTIKKLGDFTKLIANIPIGTKILIDGPYGTFTSQKSKKDKILLIAGGFGITPIRALIEDLAPNHNNLILLYSIRRRAQTIFKDELSAMEKLYNNFKIYYIFNEEDNDHGFNLINEACISHLVPDVAEREVYICGPSEMMKAIKQQLINLKVNKINIYYEKFSL